MMTNQWVLLQNWYKDLIIDLLESEKQSKYDYYAWKKVSKIFRIHKVLMRNKYKCPWILF